MNQSLTALVVSLGSQSCTLDLRGTPMNECEVIFPCSNQRRRRSRERGSSRGREVSPINHMVWVRPKG